MKRRAHLSEWNHPLRVVLEPSRGIGRSNIDKSATFTTQNKRLEKYAEARGMCSVDEDRKVLNSWSIGTSANTLKAKEKQ